MDPLTSERSLAFGEPPVYSSRDFMTIHSSERPTIPGQWYPGGSTFTISLKNLGQNEFLDVNRMALQFSVVSVVQPLPDTPIPDATAALSMKNARSSAAVLPGVPAFGCPFFSSASLQIPGLGLESFLRADRESQEIVASRLMCSSGVGSYNENLGRVGGFRISGKAYDAGARDVAARSECVFAPRIWTDRTDGTPAVAASFGGVVTHYSVPLSLFSHLMNGLSCLLPLGYMSSTGDLLNMTFRLADPSSALCDVGLERPELAGRSQFYIIDPAVSYTKTQINSTSILAGIEALYRGVSSVPIAPGLSAPMVMTMKTIDYTSATTNVLGASGAFQLTIPANQPSMRGIMLKFSADDVVNGGLRSTPGGSSTEGIGKQWAGKHAFTLVPRLRNLQIRIGSYRVPLDALSDLRYDPASIPGLASNPFAGFSGATTPLDCLSTQREAQRLYVSGKHLFSPFMVDEDFDTDALAPFWATPVSTSYTAASELFGPAEISNAEIVSGASNYYQVGDRSGTGLFVIPFETIAAVLNQRADAYALRGLELRNISSIQVTGIIDGVATGQGPTHPESTMTTSSWTIRAMCAFDNLISVLPGRLDLSSQFSLIPTGATAIPTNSGA